MILLALIKWSLQELSKTHEYSRLEYEFRFIIPGLQGKKTV